MELVTILTPGDSELLPGIKLQTKKGKPINNNQRLEMPPARRPAVKRNIENETRKAILRSLTQTYNCLGLVFASRRTCVHERELGKILSDDGYRRLGSANDLQPGDLVIYRNPDTGEFKHIGIVIAHGPIMHGSDIDITWVLSQFNVDGEWIHPIDDVPTFSGQPVEYLTERKA